MAPIKNKQGIHVGQTQGCSVSGTHSPFSSLLAASCKDDMITGIFTPGALAESELRVHAEQTQGYISRSGFQSPLTAAVAAPCRPAPTGHQTCER